MTVDTSIIGASAGSRRVHVERGPVEFFATALKDANPVYHDAAAAAAAGFAGIPAPPTYSFVMSHQGTRGEEQPPDRSGGSNPGFSVIGALMREHGGLVLHGEQEFVYHRPIVAGDVLDGESTVVDVYEKTAKGSIMVFIVTETVWRDAAGEPVVTERFNLIHRRAAQ
ncbi:MAG: MaoC family dehydratase [Actinobacteria bacterium]|nr:MaoC family dehydratase [Actinomycetota bacterium]